MDSEIVVVSLGREVFVGEPAGIRMPDDEVGRTTVDAY